MSEPRGMRWISSCMCANMMADEQETGERGAVDERNISGGSLGSDP